jgi:aryl-alcohol dehydrogenase-like predicted oxidoreductase
LREIWAALPEGDYGNIVKLLILTGQRRTEIGDLRWSEIDLKRSVIALPPERTKNILMVRGDPLYQERTIAHAIAAGVNYFDTAVQYGNGESEKNLGRVLHDLKASDVVVGTKVRLASAEFEHIEDAVATSLEGSLGRLRRDCIDIFHLHNAITEAGGEEALSVQQVVDDMVPAFERLRHQGKIRFLGLTAIGDTMALHQVIDARAFDSAQVVYNMLNPSAAAELPLV